MRHNSLTPTLASVTFATLATASVVSAADNLSDPYVRLSAAGWYQTPAVTVASTSGSEIDGGAVGLEESRVSGMVDAYLDIPIPLVPGIHAGVWRWQESPTIGSDVVATGGYAVAMWEIDVLDRAGVALGAGAVGQELDPGSGAAERALLPALSARGWFRFTDGLTAEARLMGGTMSDDSLLDAVAQVNWRIIGPAALIGGWRYIGSEQQLDNDDTWKLAISGPFVGASLSF